MADHSTEDGWKELQEAGDAALRLTGRFIGRSIRRVSALVRDTEKAFHQGLDPNIDDAVIIDEEADASD
jgi:hypothetical protein